MICRFLESIKKIWPILAVAFHSQFIEFLHGVSIVVIQLCALVSPWCIFYLPGPECIQGTIKDASISSQALILYRTIKL